MAAYAEAKRLPVGFLQKLGLRDSKFRGQQAIRIPYLNANGEEIAVRFRMSVGKAEPQAGKFRWKSGTKVCLYGLSLLHLAREKQQVTLVEGESDSHTLWLNGVPALGIPGAGTWREEWGEHLDGIVVIYVVLESDRGGDLVERWLTTSCIRDRVRLVRLKNAKDPSELFLQSPSGFHDAWRAALEAAVPWSEHARLQQTEREREAWQQCAELAHVRDILNQFAGALHGAGVVGEARAAKLLYLCLTSRLLEKPVSAAIKGPSSAGKSFLMQSVLDFFPPAAYYALSAMSERALAYSSEPVSHRHLVLFEAAGLQGDFASYLMRSLLSEGRVRYETVEKGRDGLKPRLIERPGPTGLLVTTTATRLHPENETRLLSVPVTDSREQTRSVIFRLAEGRDRSTDYRPWRALQEWLAVGDREVLIPYARCLADAIPPIAVRLRRDFEALLNLIRSHTLLHRASRSRDEEGRILATVEDYSAVRELVSDLMAQGVEASVPQIIRETVEAVHDLVKDPDNGVTVTALAKAIKIDKSAAWRRVRDAIDRGYLQNQEGRKGRPARLIPGEPMPEEISILPSVEALGEPGCRVVGSSGGNVTLWHEAFEERLGMLLSDGIPEEDARRLAMESAQLAAGRQENRLDGLT